MHSPVVLASFSVPPDSASSFPTLYLCPGILSSVGTATSILLLWLLVGFNQRGAPRDGRGDSGGSFIYPSAPPCHSHFELASVIAPPTGFSQNPVWTPHLCSSSPKIYQPLLVVAPRTTPSCRACLHPAHTHLMNKRFSQNTLLEWTIAWDPGWYALWPSSPTFGKFPFP